MFYVRDVVWRHAHEEDGGLVGVDVPVHPLRPRLEHLLVRHGAVHLHVLRGALVEGPLAAKSSWFPSDQRANSPSF